MAKTGNFRRNKEEEERKEIVTLPWSGEWVDINEKIEGSRSLFKSQIDGWDSRENRDDYGNIWVPETRAW